jgi:hypothetical protein
MPRKYKNTEAAKDFNRRFWDAFVTTQRKKRITNQELVNESGIGIALSQVPNFTGVSIRIDAYVGARDMCDLVTIYDLCRGLQGEKGVELQFLEVILTALGYDPNAIQEILALARKQYTLRYK